MQYNHIDAEWDWRIGYDDIGKDFRADLGFVNRVDYKYFVTTVGRTWRADGDSFLAAYALQQIMTAQKISRASSSKRTQFFLNMNGPAQSYLNALVGGSKTYWNGKTFDEQFNQLSMGFSPRRISASGRRCASKM